MSDGPVIDVREFAEAGARLTGSVLASNLTRLVDVLADTNGQVSYRIDGSVDRDGNPRFAVGVSGTLNVRCHRCLGPITFLIKARRELRFVPHPSLLPEVADEAPEVDDVVMVGDLYVLDWVEEEILLGLPMSPRHDVGDCAAPANPASESLTSGRPFAALAGLKSPHIKDQ
jgi:uncharacterized protein